MSSATAGLDLAEIVTGDRLAALAEAILLPRPIATRLGRSAPSSPTTVRFDEHRAIDEEQIQRLSASRSLFVYTHALPLFQEQVWPRLHGTGYVLITHNSDRGIGPAHLPWVDVVGDRLTHWFAQNLEVQHPKVSPLPIGIANDMWPHGDLGALRAAMGLARPTELVHISFDRRTHPDRERAWEAARRAFDASPAPARSYDAYLADLSRHRFSLCPRGNGIDTHRFWECQYLGVIPVVERSPHTERWAFEGLPMVLLDDWADLSRERLEAERTTVPAVAPALRLSHHAQRIRDAADG